jgi:CheY-like chemotaxis protein
VTVVNDGIEALEAFSREPFDLIFMDSEMPRMGGLKAAAEIRRREKGSGARVRIIAMTANVMKGYREECLAAGMDGYISKPTRRAALLETMREVIPDLLISPEEVASPSAKLDAPTDVSVALNGSSDKPFDLAPLLAGLNGNRAMLREMVRLCLDIDAPRLLGDLRAGLDKRDSYAIERAAHGIKGLVGEFRAPTMLAAAREVEDNARAGLEKAAMSSGRALLDRFVPWSQALRLATS